MRAKKMLIAGLVLTVILILVSSVSIDYSRRSTESSEITINNKKYRLLTWREEYLLTSKQGWSRSIADGDSWVTIDEGKGACPYTMFDFTRSLEKD